MNYFPESNNNYLSTMNIYLKCQENMLKYKYKLIIIFLPEHYFK
jgi:hypothetical protein